MRVADFSFELPDNLIARYPQAERSACRLRSLDSETGALAHQIFTDLLDKLASGDLLVFNNTRVIPAGYSAAKSAAVKSKSWWKEFSMISGYLHTCALPSHRKPAPHCYLGDDDSIAATMVSRHDSLFELRFDDPRDVLTLLNDAGHMPLPPYIDKPDDAADRELYQTVYGERLGAVAAPIAGLHFDETPLAALRAKRR